MPGCELPPKLKREQEEDGEAQPTNLEHILRFGIEDPYITAAKSHFKVLGSGNG
jgi:hypothetical protein